MFDVFTLITALSLTLVWQLNLPVGPQTKENGSLSFSKTKRGILRLGRFIKNASKATQDKNGSSDQCFTMYFKTLQLRLKMTKGNKQFYYYFMYLCHANCQLSTQVLL